MRSGFKRVLSLDSFGWVLAALLGLNWVIAAVAGSHGYVWTRGVFYAIALLSLPFGIWALVRQGRETQRKSGRQPAVATVALLWQKLAFLLIFSGVLGSYLNSVFPYFLDVPDWFVLANVAAGCITIAVVNGVLFFLGSRRLASQPVDPGPLRFFFRQRRKRRGRGQDES